MTGLFVGLSLGCALILLIFSARRAGLLLAAWPRPQRESESGVAYQPRVLILVPCHNEAASLPALCAALDQLIYPRDQLRICLIDDGSTDDTLARAHAWAANRVGGQVHALAHNVGKAQALNLAWHAVTTGPDAFPAEQLIIYDADHRPAPASLQALVAPLADPRVAGVSGQMRVVNGRASPAAFYAMLESHVHQFITMRAKDRLGLAPALLGANCAYRLSALAAVGGFRAGSLLEDSDLTLALTLGGWRTRWAEASRSEHRAPVSLRGYLQQHWRWNRGFHQVVGQRLSGVWANAQLAVSLKLELTFFALGYADRLALLGGALLTLLSFVWPALFWFPRWVWLVYFGVPALEMLAALYLAGEAFTLYWRLVYVPFFFALDVAVAALSNLVTVVGRPFTWGASERPAAGS